MKLKVLYFGNVLGEAYEKIKSKASQETDLLKFDGNERILFKEENEKGVIEFLGLNDMSSGCYMYDIKDYVANHDDGGCISLGDFGTELPIELYVNRLQLCIDDISEEIYNSENFDKEIIEYLKQMAIDVLNDNHSACLDELKKCNLFNY